MPMYEYRCQACAQAFEILQPMGASSEDVTCPACAHSEVKKLLSTFAASTGNRASASPAPAAGCCMGTAA